MRLPEGQEGGSVWGVCDGVQLVGSTGLHVLGIFGFHVLGSIGVNRLGSIGSYGLGSMRRSPPIWFDWFGVC